MNETLSLPQIIARIAQLTGADEQTVNYFIKEFIESIEECLLQGQSVKLKNFGHFFATSNDIRFIPEESLAEAVNQPFAAFEAMELPDYITEETLAMLTSLSQDRAQPEPQQDEASSEEPGEEEPQDDLLEQLHIPTKPYELESLPIEELSLSDTLKEIQGVKTSEPEEEEEPIEETNEVGIEDTNEVGIEDTNEVGTEEAEQPYDVETGHSVQTATTSNDNSENKEDSGSIPTEIIVDFDFDSDSASNSTPSVSESDNGFIVDDEAQDNDAIPEMGADTRGVGNLEDIVEQSQEPKAETGTSPEDNIETPTEVLSFFDLETSGTSSDKDSKEISFTSDNDKEAIDFHTSENDSHDETTQEGVDTDLDKVDNVILDSDTNLELNDDGLDQTSWDITFDSSDSNQPKSSRTISFDATEEESSLSEEQTSQAVEEDNNAASGEITSERADLEEAFSILFDESASNSDEAEEDETSADTTSENASSDLEENSLETANFSINFEEEPQEDSFEEDVVENNPSPEEESLKGHTESEDTSIDVESFINHIDKFLQQNKAQHSEPQSEHQLPQEEISENEESNNLEETNLEGFIIEEDNIEYGHSSEEPQTEETKEEGKGDPENTEETDLVEENNSETNDPLVPIEEEALIGFDIEVQNDTEGFDETLSPNDSKESQEESSNEEVSETLTYESDEESDDESDKVSDQSEYQPYADSLDNKEDYEDALETGYSGNVDEDKVDESENQEDGQSENDEPTHNPITEDLVTENPTDISQPSSQEGTTGAEENVSDSNGIGSIPPPITPSSSTQSPIGDGNIQEGGDDQESEDEEDEEDENSRVNPWRKWGIIGVIGIIVIFGILGLLSKCGHGPFSFLNSVDTIYVEGINDSAAISLPEGEISSEEETELQELDGSNIDVVGQEGEASMIEGQEAVETPDQKAQAEELAKREAEEKRIAKEKEEAQAAQRAKEAQLAQELEKAEQQKKSAEENKKAPEKPEKKEADAAQNTKDNRLANGPVYETISADSSLETIAAQYYGSPSYWVYIYLENPYLGNPRQVMAGTKVKIPPLRKYVKGGSKDAKNIQRAKQLADSINTAYSY